MPHKPSPHTQLIIRTSVTLLLLLLTSCLSYCYFYSTHPRSELLPSTSHPHPRLLAHCAHRQARYLVTFHSDHDKDLIDYGSAIVRREWEIGDAFRGASLMFGSTRECEAFWEMTAGVDARKGKGDFELTLPKGWMHVQVDCMAAIGAVQTDPPWNLDRIDQRDLPLDGSYTYPDPAGAGVDIYVVDTGININHTEFEGRARWGTTTRSDNPVDYDDNGHGSHVAGIASGKTYGASKAATLIAVKALGEEGLGPYSDVIDALVWIGRVAPRTGRPSIVNLSIEGEDSATLNAAVLALLSLSIHVVCATGNSGQNACEVSPSAMTRTNAVVSVGAMDSGDVVANFSNFGPCVTLLAPGVNIRSVLGSSNDDTILMSGTSMAAPHGTIANFLSLNGVLGDSNATNATVPSDPAGMKEYLVAYTGSAVADVVNGARR
ncbi:hypothetical protein PhCBS80983_g05670 [Powellomyces hirtus]|uniref:Peptidase S8/S53 domain-containing protein n=1 Tax=Powellomyces hirtus TaxID=109895 RepID=A0A507DT71_9FUNG|nr:hypothetical protein PhCBS80983_g05670 [Powellomyces hirtus]